MRRYSVVAAAVLVAVVGVAVRASSDRPAPPRSAGRAESTSTTDRGVAASPDAGWFGGPSYYARWDNGLSAAPDFFPIGVWLQEPKDAQEYKRMGINTYVGLWEGPTEEQLAELADAGMPAIASPTPTALSSPNSRVNRAYLLDDEPDLYGRSPEEIQAAADKARAADPSRPTYLNLGKGAALPYFGDETVQAKIRAFVQACDICSVDYYGVTDPWEKPWPINVGIRMYGVQVDRMRAFVDNRKPVWVFLEATYIYADIATAEQVESAAWMALIHGANGIQWFGHAFYSPQGEKAMWTRALLGTGETRPTVERVNADVKALAPVLNSPHIVGRVAVSSADPDVPIDTMVKSHGGKTYIFAIANTIPDKPDGGTTTGTFTLDTTATTAQVYGENRTVKISDGRIVDEFGTNGGTNFDHHIYVLDPAIPRQ